MAMNPRDESLMWRVRCGSHGDLGILFERHHRSLFAFFCRMTGDRASSEDLVQDVFHRMLRYRDTFREDSRFKPWMYGIARNVQSDFSSKRRIESPFVEDSDDIPDYSSTPARDFDRAERFAFLRCALLKLPEDRRELIVLFQYQEMKPDEIAELLGIEPGTVRVRVHRALKELRGIFLKLYGEKAICSVKKSESNLRNT
jgi:RNA polymerase sigma-70 factor (ECF subfamily)